MSSSGSKAWSGSTKKVKMTILVGAIQVQRTQTRKLYKDYSCSNCKQPGHTRPNCNQPVPLL
ncbi:hypothetical protein F2Q68_00031874 [Brassica cretica]|uniref:CCHC-type domain-containing protein n=1 Tax=Brassica cretica TaxID=69181 RepID=A0A8S9G4K3_BRACR|nr:hypothetical protein F2Q68_00031874 [Brassica cretica]